MPNILPNWLLLKCGRCNGTIARENVQFPGTDINNNQPEYHRTDDHGFHFCEIDTYETTRPLPFHHQALLKKCSYIIDDVELKCGHHFHRECLQKFYGHPHEYERWRKCPHRDGNCDIDEVNEQGRLLITWITEGGVTVGLDLSSEFERGNKVLERISKRRDLDLLQAIESHRIDKIELLLDEGASPNTEYPDDHVSAHHLAALHEQFEIAELLLQPFNYFSHGASQSVHRWASFEAENGYYHWYRTPFDIALANGDSKMVGLLAPFEVSREPRPRLPGYELPLWGLWAENNQ